MFDDGRVAGPYSAGMGYLLWLACFVGACGVHRFYLGQHGRGVLYLLTFGLFGVGQLFDVFRMETLVRNANSQYERIPRWRRRQKARLAGDDASRHGEGPNDHERPRQATRLLDDDTKDGAPDAKRPSQDLPQLLLDAAIENGGDLTVTQGVMATGKGFKEVESTLAEMSTKGYVDVDNAESSGSVVYRFPALAKQPMLRSARTAVAQVHATVRGKRLSGIGRRQQQLLQAALENGGELTVTQGVMATRKGFDEIEGALTEMSHWDYVDMDNLPGSGVVVYRFRELLELPEPKSARTVVTRMRTTVRDALSRRSPIKKGSAK